MRRPFSLLKPRGRQGSTLAFSLLLSACTASGFLENPGQSSPQPTPKAPAPAPTTPPVQMQNPAPAPTTPPSNPGGTQPVQTLPPVMNAPAPMPLPAAMLSMEGIPSEVQSILQGRCAGCHTYGQGDLAGWGSVLDLSRMIDAEIVTPGSPNTSRMIDRIQVRGDMPP